jgi:serine/threonine-protein kinase
MHKTRSGSVMGTPLYMSPEQCRDSANIDFRTDIYSLGCVFFEMLTGRPPFVRDNFGDLLVAHITEEAPDPRAFVPAVPAPLAELLGELLRKDPSERPSSARQVAERLMTYVARMTTVPGAAAFKPGAAPAPARAVGATTAPPAGAATAPPAAVRTTFGASASEVATDETLERPPRRKGPLFAALLLVAGGGVAVALALKPKPDAPPVTVPPAPVAVSPAPVAPSPAPAPPPAPVARKAEPAPERPAPPSPPAAKPGKPARTVIASSTSRREPAPTPAPATAPAATAPPPPAAEERRAAAPHVGAWEGPWIDTANGQRGRLFLQVGPGGSVAGWMYNTSAKLSFRMSGSMKRDGAVDLDCQCPPGQAFSARGTFSPDEDGDLKADVALSAQAGVFGHARVTLRRNASAPPR